jgi:4-aminobutyrate aminotransferase-like enzyme
MVALELVQDRATREPDSALCARVVTEAQDRGVILLSAGIRSNVIRLLPALTIPDEILAEGLDILQESLEASVSITARAAA